MKKFFSLFLTTLLLLAPMNANAYTLNKNSNSIIEFDNSDSLTSVNYTDNHSTYTYEVPTEDEMKNFLENQLNKEQVNSRNASGYYKLKQISNNSTSKKWTGANKISGQNPNGVRFQYGGQIHYKDGVSYNVPLSLSIKINEVSKLFGFSVGIGSFSSTPTTYAINIPSGKFYHAYANKQMQLYVYEKYYVNPASGAENFVGYQTGQAQLAIDFTVREV